MEELEQIIQLAEQVGFSHAGELKLAALEFRPEVRAMCADDRCGNYGKTWTCPPGCGTLEEITARAAQYSVGVLLQSTGQLEDKFDVETMLDTGKLQKERMDALLPQVRALYPNCLPMGAGGCGQCAQCTYPDAPCRHPDLAYPSMEAYGLVVSDVCRASGVPYYYGENTITYTGCILLR
jgi:predicted metal-binding protein